MMPASGCLFLNYVSSARRTLPAKVTKKLLELTPFRARREQLRLTFGSLASALRRYLVAPPLSRAASARQGILVFVPKTTSRRRRWENRTGVIQPFHISPISAIILFSKSQRVRTLSHFLPS